MNGKDFDMETECNARPKFDPNDLKMIQEHFHNLILERAESLDWFMAQEDKKLPTITNETWTNGTDSEWYPARGTYEEKNHWYPVPGMYGGFKYWLIEKNGCPILITESWCRVVGGSGQRHEVSVDGYVLMEEGFV